MEAADSSVHQFQGKSLPQSLKHTKCDIATILKVMVLFLNLVEFCCIFKICFHMY